MPINPLVLELLERVIESGLSAEDVCRDRPELIVEVRACLRQLSSVQDELDALFPEENAPNPGPRPRATPAIPGYVMGDIVGRGGMGVVYKARQLRLNREVAIKMMLNGGFAGPPELARFQLEAEALAALQHPNIVQVYDVGESGGLPYFTMELVEGGNLAQKLGGVPLSAREAATFMIALAVAVETAHRGGIVHRDLKPSNILLTAGGTPKITDFGLARRLEAGIGLSMTATRIGTPGYMAPEQVAGHARVSGAAADIYSLGAVFYEMLTGRPPFRADTLAETERQVIAEEPAPPSRLNAKIPRDLETICLKCLNKEPGRRYASAAEFGEDIGRFLRGEPIRARPVCSAERVAKWMRRHPARAVTMFGGSALATAFLIGGWWAITSRALATHAIEEDLSVATQALRRSASTEAHAALERARGRLGPTGHDASRQRLAQADKDLELTRQLAALRLDRIAGIGPAPGRWLAEYEKAFRKAGLLNLQEPTRVVADRLGRSDIRAALVAAIDDWSLCAYLNDDQGTEARLLEVARTIDPGAWSDRLRNPAARRDRGELTRLAGSAKLEETPVHLLALLGELLWRTEGDAIPFLKAVQRHHPNDIMVSCLLGFDALNRKDAAEAVRNYQTALAIRPGTPFLYSALGQSLARGQRWVEAVPYYADAVRLDPEDGMLRLAFGDCLVAAGREADAADQFSRALEFERNDRWRGVLRDRLRSCRLRLGDLDRADTLWQESLKSAPPDHQAWEGYAEFCLFRGRPDEYRATCNSLLRRYGATHDARIAERTGRACLMSPSMNGALAEATALIDMALGDKSEELAWARPFFLVAKGLAEYRHGRLESALTIMEGPASPALQPIPRLVSAMALFRMGRKEEAHKTLTEAIRSGDWDMAHAIDREKWIYHILRREAEALMRPDIPSVQDVQYSPQNKK